VPHRCATVVVLLGSLLAARSASAQELSPVSLPAPQTEGGKPLMQALKLRDNQLIVFAQSVGFPKK
jgi:hypothetical protein